MSLEFPTWSMGLGLTPRYLSAQAVCGVAPEPEGTCFSRLNASLPVMYEAIVAVVGVCCEVEGW